MTVEKVLTRVVLPVGILLMGLLCAFTLVKLAPTAERATPSPRVATVEAIVPSVSDHVARIEATGSVMAEQQIVLVPEVGGRVTWVSDKLRTGGRFTKGETLARIDSRDYAIAVAQEKSRVRQAELEYELELGRQQTAKREWALLSEEGASSKLALRVPHLALAEQNLEAARSGLERAELNLGRTALRAPFDSMVLTEQVDVGQVVGPGTQAATLIGTERFRLEISVPVDSLHAIAVPAEGASDGSPVRVVHDVGTGDPIVRTGRVSGVGGQLDPGTRTAKVLVLVDDPLDPPEGERPLFAGAYVSVSIAGRPIPGALEVPRQALQQGHFVWVADAESNLRKREVDIVWRGAESVFVRSSASTSVTGSGPAVTRGIVDGDRIVVSPLPLPIEGMPLDVKNPAASAPALGDAGRAQQ